MESGDVVGLACVVALFIGLPWVILHYVTKWKTAATLTTDDEALLEELYQLARRLDERMDTVERLVASEHPEFHPAVPQSSFLGPTAKSTTTRCARLNVCAPALPTGASDEPDPHPFLP
jgi:phage shock protein B